MGDTAHIFRFRKARGCEGHASVASAGCWQLWYSMRKLMLYQILLVLGILVLSMTAAEEAAVLDAANSGDNLAREGLTLLQVTPQIPDGPVVRKFKKLDAKKRLDKQIVKQNKVLKPMLKRKKMKKKAVKNKMGMLADLAIKKRKTKEEL